MRNSGVRTIVKVLLILTLLYMIFPYKWFRSRFEKISGANVHVTTFSPSTDKHVPNLVHFIRFGTNNLTFIDAVCILAALKNQRPLRLYIHTDQENFDGGKYWDVVVNHPKAKGVVEVKYLRMPRSIFGKGFNPSYLKWHASDVERLRILIKYGGIYLDNDSYIVNSLEDFFDHEMTLGWEDGGGISDQVLIAKKNARFLRIWLESYRDYRRDEWFYNGGELPTKLLKLQPHLVNAVRTKFAEYKTTPELLYYKDSATWREHYAIHLLINHQYILPSNLSKTATYPVEFNETNILKYPVNIRQMALDVFPFEEQIRKEFEVYYPNPSRHPGGRRQRRRRRSTESMDMILRNVQFDESKRI